MPHTYLEQWNNPALPVNENMDWDTYAKEQKNRTMRLSIIARHASEFKHRLGQDASRGELAADKQLSRGLANHWRQYSEQWGATKQEFDDYETAHHEELHRLGAQVDWAKQVEEQYGYMSRQLQLVATTCIKNGEIKVGNKLCNRLLNEAQVVQNAYKRALRKAENTDEKSAKTAKKSRKSS